MCFTEHAHACTPAASGSRTRAWDDHTQMPKLRVAIAGATGYTGNLRIAVHAFRRLTPSNASHTYSIRGFVTSGTGVAAAGAGGSTALMPAFIRITKV